MIRLLPSDLTAAALAGVYRTFARGSFADLVYERLAAEKDAIGKELRVDVELVADFETSKYVIRHVSDETWDDSR